MTKLHLGCGPLHLDGWINIDNVRYPGVDKVLDLRKGLPYKNVGFIFAEHFIEHLSYEASVALMTECRRVLCDDGVLRLSTPNLDWVWLTHYHLDFGPDEDVAGCFRINRAFRGWGHQFLWNETTLVATLQAAGFAEVVRREYRQSDHPELQNLERHEQSPAYGSISDILIVEASGRGTGGRSLEPMRSEFLRDVKVT